MITHRKIQQSFRKQENSPYVKMRDWLSPPYNVNCPPSERVLTPSKWCWLVISFSQKWLTDTDRSWLFGEKNPTEFRPIGSKVKIWPKFVRISSLNYIAWKFNSLRILVKFQSVFGLDVCIKGLSSKCCLQSSRTSFKIINIQSKH